MANFNEAYPFVLAHEKGYENDKDDKGGATKDGISLRFLKALSTKNFDGILDIDYNKNGMLDSIDIQHLSDEDIQLLYKKEFWDKLNLDSISDQSVATKLFDMCVNMGCREAVMLTQRACSYFTKTPLTLDGILGERTLELIKQITPQLLLQKLRSECAWYYQVLVGKNPQWRKYWMQSNGKPGGWQIRAYS